MIAVTSSTWQALGSLCEGMDDLRTRFMRLADDRRDAEETWERMESSMEEDEIEEYLNDLERSGHRVQTREGWESDLEFLQRVWKTEQFWDPDPGDIADAPRSLTAHGDVLSVLRRGLGRIITVIYADSQQYEDDDTKDAALAILQNWAEKLAVKLKSTTSETRQMTLNPIEVYLLLLSSRRAMEPYTGAHDGLRGQVAAALTAIVLKLIQQDVNRGDPKIRVFRDFYSKLRALAP